MWSITNKKVKTATFYLIYAFFLWVFLSFYVFKNKTNIFFLPNSLVFYQT